MRGGNVKHHFIIEIMTPIIETMTPITVAMTPISFLVDMLAHFNYKE